MTVTAVTVTAMAATAVVATAVVVTAVAAVTSTAGAKTGCASRARSPVSRFDSFGDFEGFWLRTQDGLREFSSRERDMELLVSRAWRQQVALLVIAERHAPHRPVSIVLLRAPLPE